MKPSSRYSQGRQRRLTKGLKIGSNSRLSRSQRVKFKKSRVGGMTGKPANGALSKPSYMGTPKPPSKTGALTKTKPKPNPFAGTLGGLGGPGKNYGGVFG